MKNTRVSQTVTIPDDVTVECKARQFVVKGPRGSLTRDFRHVEMEIIRPTKGKMQVVLWNSGRKHTACMRTICTHIQNMIKGVTSGFSYKMRFVYAHFPINVNIADGGSLVEIRNFLGERIVRRVKLLPGVSVEQTKDVKDELKLTGNDILNVSQSAAKISQSVLVKNKDIRKFLDGIYVSEKGLLGQEKAI